MRFSSLHTHTVFCDGRDDVETMCRAAWEKGLVSIGFSGHAPIAKKTGMTTDWHIREDRLEAYLDEVRSARRRWESRLPVYLGLEVDFIDGLIGPADYRGLGLDYIIGSVHYVVPPKGRPFTVDGRPEELEKGIREGFGGDGEALMECYWDTVVNMISAGGFDILGHVDLVKKNNGDGLWFSPEGEAWRRKAAETAGAAKNTGTRIVLEINTGGINRKKISETYPSIPLLRLFREKGVPVTITADAHRAGDLDGNYQAALKALTASGYTEALLFEGRKDGKALWSAEAAEKSG
jgi:histidinol-phosphatase (PHP family)